MKAFLASLAVAAVVALGAMFTLDAVWQRRADQAFASANSVRVPDHGTVHNLVGRDWYSSRNH